MRDLKSIIDDNRTVGAFYLHRVDEMSDWPKVSTSEQAEARRFHGERIAARAAANRPWSEK